MVATRVWDDLFSGAMLVAGTSTVPWPQMPEVVGWGGFVLQSVDIQNMFFSAKTLPEKFPNLIVMDSRSCIVPAKLGTVIVSTI